jgi:hypothetical protein
MSDGTSSEASYSYESDSQHWDFGDDSSFEDEDQFNDVFGHRFEDGALQAETGTPQARGGDPQISGGQPHDSSAEPQLASVAGQGVSSGGDPTGADPRSQARADTGANASGPRDSVRIRLVQDDQGVESDSDESDSGRVRGSSTVIHLNGLQYTRARQSSVKIAYRCSFYRRTTK